MEAYVDVSLRPIKKSSCTRVPLLSISPTTEKHGEQFCFFPPGIIFYNGQTAAGGSDFVSFGLDQGFPEFRHGRSKGNGLFLLEKFSIL